MDELQRIILTAHDGTALGDIDPDTIAEAIAVAEVNGENYLSLTTTQVLGKGDRLLLRDGMGVWHEYVVEGIEGEHAIGDTLHTYHCPWSVQYDLCRTYVSAMPGTGGTLATALQALTAALGGTARWTVGTVDVTTTGSASMFRMSGWAALQVLVETWGGEIEPVITVSTNGVAARAVNLLNHVGSTTATRRFDYGADVVGIKRTVSDEPWTARVIPLGAALETDGGGYGRKLTIESVNGGVMWLENADAVPLTRVPDGNGGWEIPVQIVENDTIEDATKLKQWAQDNIAQWTEPKVSYEATVVQLEGAGMGAHGIELGDACTVVDTAFGPAALRLTTRLLRIEENLLDRSQSVLTFSNLVDSLGSQLADIARSVAEVQSQVTNLSLNQATSDYVSALLARINMEANATGGYTYITEGQGLRCYDAAVTDPLTGAEASQVIELKGGTWRIANTKDGGGNWQWRTVGTGAGIIADSITSGTIDASVVTIANLLMIGYAGSNHVGVTSDGVEIYGGDGASVINVGENNAVRVGESSALNATIDGDSFDLNKNGNTVATMGDQTLYVGAVGVVNQSVFSYANGSLTVGTQAGTRYHMDQTNGHAFRAGGQDKMTITGDGVSISDVDDLTTTLAALGFSYGSSATSLGTWKWLKLPNGLAIAEYIDDSDRTVACTSQTGDTYWGTVYSIALPFTFSSVPQLNCSPSGNNNYFVQISAGTTTATGNIYLCRSSSSTFVGKIHVTAIGRYE